MSEEKLTVAELMARASKEGHSSDTPRRRRRRSLEDGGVSVAELTGSIPAVKEKPAEARHSAVPLDAPAELEQPEQPEEQAEPEATTAERPAAPESGSAAAPPAESTEEAAEEADAAESEATAETAATSRPAPSNDETMVLSIVDEKDPIRLTTGAFPVVPATAATPLVQKRDKDGPADAEAAARAEFADTPARPAAPVAVAPAAAAASSSESTSLLEPITDADLAEVEDAEEGAKSSFLPILLMAVVGVILGVVVFLAFEMLWGRLNFWLVSLLAVLVTLGMVGITHALRTSRDRFSMVLAGVVGLVMTFGPLAIVM